MKHTFLAAASGLAISTFLIATPVLAQGERTDANGMPTTHSTPAEQARPPRSTTRSRPAMPPPTVRPPPATPPIRRSSSSIKTSCSRIRHSSRTIRIAPRPIRVCAARYAAERAAYHRGIWPDRYVKWVLVEPDTKLIGERVELITGNRVGTVIDTAHAPGGNVEALLVRLDSDKVVWIDAQDVRYNRADGIVMTNLDSVDLHHMADERG